MISKGIADGDLLGKNDKKEELSKFVGGGIIKNVRSVRKTNFSRENRTAQGYEVTVKYGVGLTV